MYPGVIREIKGDFKMSRFYASIQGNRGTATRQGTEKSGIYGHIRGWNIGAYVSVDVNDNGEDEVTIELSSGSNADVKSEMIGVFTRKDLKGNA